MKKVLTRSFCVYKHTNIVNNKVYIGITCRNLPARCGRGGRAYRSSPHFYSAICKYGWENFTHEILQEGLTELEAELLEEHLIQKYDSANPDKGYNIKLSDVAGHPQISEQERQRRSERMSGDNSPSKRPEVREKISKSCKGRIPWNLGLPGNMLGKHQTSEVIEHMREVRLGQPHPHKSGREEGLKWYNNGQKNVLAKECPEGYVKGRLYRRKEGLKWCNNGTQQRCFNPEKGIPEGYVEGKLKTNLHWYNNQISEIQAKECPEGYVNGRLYERKNKECLKKT